MTKPPKSEIVKEWEDWLIENVFDLGEPSCWSCRKRWGTKYDIKSPDITREELFENWNNVKPLQKCHIVPKSISGSDEASNLFLMCRECHDLAPDTPYRDIFFKWVEKQNWMKREANKIKKQMEYFDIDMRKLEIYYNIFQSEDFRNWVDEKVGIHGSQRGFGTTISKSTLIGLLWKYKNEVSDEY